MILKDPARILITAPMKKMDATEYTYQWALKAVQMSRRLGFNVKVIDKDNVTRKNVETAIYEFQPRLVIHLGHGCQKSLQGQKECIINVNYPIDKIISMAYSPEQRIRQKAYDLLSTTFQISNSYLPQDPCDLACQFSTNVDKLKGCIMVAIACHSSAVLGLDAIDCGIQAYAGMKDLLIFPVDGLGTQNLYGDMELVFLRELLLTQTMKSAYKAKIEVMDDFIKKNKKIKYLALTTLWNRLNFEILGDKNAMIYQYQ